MAPVPEAVAQTPIIEIDGDGKIPEGTDRIFTVNLKSEISTDLQVSCKTIKIAAYKYAKEGNRKTDDADYIKINNDNCGTFTATGGKDQSFTVEVETIEDNYYEPDEKFILEITGGGTTDTKTITIINNDSPPRVTIVASPEEVTEGGSVNLTLTLLDRDKVDYPITYTYFFPENRTATASQGGYGGTTMLDVEEITTRRTITINDGETTATASFQTVDDSIYEPDEELVVNIAGDGIYDGGASSVSLTITIKDNDKMTGDIPVYLAGENGSGLRTQLYINEGGKARVEAMLPDPTDKNITIPITATPISATANRDDFKISNEITIQSGLKEGSTDLTIENDTANEPRYEGLIIELGSMPEGFTKGDRSKLAVVMIDDDPLKVTLRNLSPKTISEDNGKATFEVHIMDRGLATVPNPKPEGFDKMSLGEQYGLQAVLNYSAKASNGALKNEDFTTSADPTDFHKCPDRRTCEVTVTAKDDNYYEGTEGVEISLSTSSTHEAASIRITGDPLSLSIEDDDMVPSVKLSVDADTGTDSVQNSLAEDGGEKMVRVTATLEGGSVFPEAKTVTVEVGAADDDATEDTDYTRVGTQRITINEGETSGYVDFPLTPTQDVLHEGNETISVNGMLEGVEVEDTTITITDDDSAPSGITLSVDTNGSTEGTPSTVAEDAEATVVTVTATVNGETRYVDAKIVAVSVADGSAASPADYGAVENFDIIIAAGAASQTGSFTVTPVDDDLDEPNETIDVTGTLTDITITGATVTLTDTDDPVSFSIADAEATEGGKVTFTVNRAGAEDNVATVKIATAADSGDGVIAAGTDDYTAIATAQTLNFAAGVTSQTVEVQTTQDDLFEPDETFRAVLSAPALAGGDPGTGVSIESGKGTATGTIKNDDTEPSFAVADASAAEGDAITFTVTRSGAMDNVVSVKWKTKAFTGAGAASASDYTEMTTATKLDFAKGVSSQTFTVTTTEDLLHEGNETFLVELTDAVGGTITTAEATGTINDDDAAPTGITLSVDTNGAEDGTPSTVAEDAGATVVTVTATVNGTTRYVDAKTVAVSVADNTATSPADYAAVNNFDITIAAGAASHTGSFTVTPVDDKLDEDNETIDVTGTLSGITITGATVTLTDTDNPVSFSIADAEATEGGKVTFTVTRSGAMDNVASVKVATAADSGDDVNAADADDYTAITTVQTLNFAAGVTTQMVEVQTTQDDLFEPDETFKAVLSDPALGENDPGTRVSIETGKGTATGTIKNDDTEPSFAVADASAAEGDAITFTVTRSGAMDNVVSVKWNTKAATGDDAASATDYTAMNTAAKLDFAKGIRTQTFTVATTEDTLNEADETFLVELTEPMSATISDAEATGTITNDDAPPTTLTLAVDADNGTENVQSSLAENGGAKTVKVTATLGGATQFDADKTLTLIVGDDDDSATEGTDYTTVDDITLTIPAGDQNVEHTFTLTPTDDAFREDSETISFDATLGGITVAGTSITLTSDDAAPAITLTVDADKDTDNVQTSLAEDGGVKTVRVTATLDGTTRLEEAANLTLAVGKNSDSATEGTDYTTVEDRTITIGAGVASVTHDFTLTPTNDDLYEGSETISLDGTLEGVAVTNTSLTLTDDDAQPSFAVADASAAEGDAITFTVTRSGAMDNVVSVKWNTKAATGDDAASATDYTAMNTAAKLDFAKGIRTQTFTVATTEDTLNEADETFLVELTEPMSATISDAEATGTITNDDAPPTTLTLAVDADNGTENVQSSLAENGGAKTVKVTATLGGATQFDADKTLTLIVGDDDDSATEGTDYTTVDDITLTIPAGDQNVEHTFTLTPTDDAFREDSETISFDATLGGITVAGTSITLTSDDAAPAITLTVDADKDTDNVQTSLAEDGGVKTVRVTATLDGTTRLEEAANLTLAVGKNSDSATEGTDYTTVEDRTITIGAGVASVTHDFTLTPTNDDLYEGSETISLDGTLEGVAVTNTSLTLTDDDAQPSFAVADASAAEGDAITFTVTRSGAMDNVVSVKWNTKAATGDDAASATDYTAMNTAAKLDFAKGIRTQTFTVATTEDTLNEADETFLVELTEPMSATISDAEATGTITNDDAPPTTLTLAVDADNGTENVQSSLAENGGAKTVKVTATLGGATQFDADKTLTLIVGDDDDSATEGTDYTTVDDITLTIPAGDQNVEHTFTLTPTDDAFREDSETISFDATLGGITVAGTSITLTSDDAAPAITLTVDADKDTDNVQTSLAEDGGVKTVRVTATLDGTTRLEEAANLTLAVGKNSDSATEGTDYTTVEDRTITIGAGVASVTHDFTLTPTNDDLYEGSETISLDGTLEGVAVTNTSLTLTDDDAQPSGITLSVSPTAVGEEDGETKITVTATVNGSTRYVDAKTVTVSVGGGTAISGTDYDSVANFDITIAAGEASKSGTFDLMPTNDVLDEANETINVTGTSGSLTITPATITITDNDDAPSGITISVSPATVGEGAGKTEITVTATVNGSTRYVDAKTVTVSVGGGTATSATDYGAVENFNITIAAGEASKSGTFDLMPTNDVLDEVNETINVTGTSGSLTITPATITITDNDDAPSGITLSVSPATVGEGAGKTEITVTATVNGETRYVDAKTVTVSVGGGTATSATDYGAVENFNITIAAGEASKSGTFDLMPTNDVLDEVNETINVTGTSGSLTITPATITITDNDDAPSGITLSVSPATVGEGAGKTEITVTATVNGSTRYVDAKTVTVSVGGGTATSATDYGAVENFNITIAAGEASKSGTFDLMPTNDVLDEVNETINVTGTSGSLTITPATITITDNDDAPSGITLSVSPATVGEGAGKTEITVTATVNGETRYVDAKTVTVSVGGGTATSATDYGAVENFNITIAAGEASKSGTFDLMPTNDVLDEVNETINVTGTSGSLTITPATITITDNDDAPSGITLSVSPATVGEGAGKTEITVTATVNGSTRYVDAKTVTVSVGGGTATSATDYGAVENFNITIAAGEASKSGTFDLMPTNDVLDEVNETINVTGTSGSLTITPATITITDNDDAPSGITLSVSPATVGEGAGKTEITVTATVNGETRYVDAKTVTVSVGGGTATSATDYGAVENFNITIAAGEASKSGTFDLMPTNDVLDEVNETINVTGTSGSLTITPATITITDNDDAPSGITLSVSPATVGEGAGKTEITVTATVNGSTRYVDAKTVTVSVGGGTATSATDYGAVENFNITIAAGEASKSGTFDLMPTNDVLDEVNETINVTGTSGSLTITPATITITDNDDAPSGITLSVSPATVGEGAGKTEITVTATVNGETRYVDAKTVTVSVGGGTATSATDYGAVENFNITIAAGEASKSGTFDLMPTNDVLDEANETINVTGTSGSLTITPATITITDNDDAPSGITLSVSPATVGEGAGKTEITVTATVNGETRYVDAKTVTVSVGGGTATSATDYGAVENFNITIAAGEASKSGTFDLMPTNDVLDEANETINVTGTSGSLTITPATITITDNDDAPSGITISVDADTGTNGTQTTIAEGGGVKTVRVTATITDATRFVEAKTVTLDVGADADSATEGTDYDEVTTKSITINSGSSSGYVEFTITPTNDTLHEGSETISLDGTLTGVTVTDASITLTDDDGAPTALTLTVDADTGTNNVQTSLAENGGAKTVRVTATLGGSSTFTESKTVTLEVGAGTDSATEGTDYTEVTSKSITIDAEASSGYVEFTITPTNDTLHEGSETISLDGTLDGVTVTDATITLTDNDAAPTTLTLAIDADNNTENVQSSLAENGGAKTVKVTATLGGATQFDADKTLTLIVGDDDDSATEGTDYTTVDDITLTIPAGDQNVEHTFTLTPTDDAFREDSETISFDATLGGITVAGTSITLTSDDAAPAITLTVDADKDTDNVQTSLAEDGGVKTVRVTATLDGTTRLEEAANLTLAVGKNSDSATEGTDYTTVEDRTITIGAGVASVTHDFTLTPTNDDLYEGSETISLDGTLEGVAVTNTSLTLTDDDAAPSGITLSVSPTAVGEEDGETKITVTATVNGSTRYVDAKTVTVSVGGGTAISGTDYDSVSNFDITIAAGDASKDGTFDLTPTNDVLDEANETINVTGTSGSLTITPATVTINDDDDAPGAITISVDADTGAVGTQTTIAEDGGAKTVRVTATITDATRFVEAKTVTLEVGAGTDSATEVTDYAEVTSKSISINAGDSSGYVEFTITPTDDTLHEGSETISLDGTLAGVTVTDASITLTDNDGAPTALTISVDADTGTDGTQTTIAEDGGVKTVRVTATLAGSSTFKEAKTVTLEVGAGTDSATEVTDYAEVTSKSISINAGDSSGYVEFTITPTDDTLHEGSETISLDGTLAGVTVTDASITLTDNDGAPTALTISVDADTGTDGTQTTIAEDGGVKTVRVTATLAGSSTFKEAKTVTLEVGAGTDSATEVTDYAEVTSKSISINAGDLSGYVEFTITPTDDTLHEGSETISLDGTLAGVTVTDASITLTDNDGAPTALTISVDADTGTDGTQTTIAEDGGVKTVRVTATLAGSSTFKEAKTVTLEVGAGTDSATEVTDYAEVTSKSISINAGDSSGYVEFTITPTDDTLHEGSETISLDGTLAGVTVTDASITLTDNDGAPTALTISVDADTGTDGTQTTIAEDGGVKTVRVTATLAGSSTFKEAKTVTLEVGAGTDSATEVTDYAEVTSKSISINAGDSSGYVEFTITPTDDTLHEGSETISLDGTLAGVTVTDASITLTDNDGAPTALTISVDADTGTDGTQTTIAEDGGVKTVRVTATLAGSSTFKEAKTVTLEVGAGTDSATEVTDYAEVTSKSISINAGDSSGYVEFTITPTDDTLHEGSETISLDGTLAGVTVTDASITLTDNDGAPTALTISVDADTGTDGTQTTIAEDGGVKTVRVTATLAGSSTFKEAKTVTLEVGAGTDSATEVTDYAEVTSKSISINAGDSSGYVEFTITPTDDTLHEGSETISLDGTLAGVTVTDASITLTDNDGAPTALTISVDADTGTDGTQTTIAEDGGVKTVRVTATLAGSSTFTEAKTVTLEVGAGTDSATEVTDYAEVTSKSISINAGDSSGYVEFTITPTDDTLHEGSETISLDGTLAGVTVTDASITLTDNDGAPTALTISVDADTGTDGTQTTIAEDGGVKTVRVTATLAGSSTFKEAKTVTLEVGAGTDSATEVTDYAEVTSKSISINAGDSSGYVEFTITPTDDTLHEGSETISLDGTLTGVTVTDASITLTDNDGAPTALTISVDADTGTDGTQTTIAEDGGVKTVRVTATLAGSSTFKEAKTVTLEVGAGTDSATEVTDYAEVTSKSISINAGDSSGYVEFTITPTDDTLHEGSETISLDGTLAGVTVTDASITLTDNDGAPTALTISVDADTGTDGTQTTIAEDGGVKTVRVTATLAGSSTFKEAKTVTLEVGAGTDSATEVTDYAEVTSKSISINAGDSSGYVEFTITPTDDTLHEGSETISLDGTLAGVTVTDASITLTDNDGAPTALTISVDADTGTDGTQTTIAEDGGVKTVRVTATLAGSSTFKEAKTVTLEVGAGTDSATEVTDYAEVTSKSISINAGDSSGYVEFTITPTDDTLHEGSETISLDGTLAGVTVTDASITLTDNDGAPTALTISVDADTGTDGTQTTIAEDGGVKTVRVTATLAGSSTFKEAKTVTLEVGAGTDSATEVTDYAEVTSKSITINAGDLSGYVEFTITPTDDTLHEGSETISLDGTLAGVTVTDASITLTDNDGAPTALTISVDADTGTDGTQTTIAEDGGVKTVRVTATLAGSSTFKEAKTVTLEVGAGTDSATEVTDYAEVTSKSITINAGDSSGYVEFTITPTDDTLHEGSETISLDGTLAGVTVTDASITLTDNDGAPTALTISVDADTGTDGTQTTIAEDGGVKTVRVTATLAGSSTFKEAKTVTLEVGAGTDSATEVTDYAEVTSKSISINAGDSSGYVEFTITPTDDTLHEGSETISLDGTLAGVTVTDASITLTDNDGAPTALTISVDADTGTDGTQTTIAEDGGVKTVRVTATLAGSSTFKEAKTVTLEVGAGTDSATEVTDYAEVTSKSITINAGDSSGYVEFTITPTDDTLHEGSETISLDGTLAGVTVTDASITLTDNDGAPTALTLSVSPATVGEGNGETEITVTATVNGSTRYGDAKTVRVSVGGGTAISGTDYTTVPSFDITIGAGEASKTGTFDLTPTDDDLDEENETIDVTGNSGSITVTKTTVTINDNEGTPTVTLALSPSSISENGGICTVTATLLGKSDKAVTVTVAAAAGVNTAAGDFTLSTNKTLTIAAGATTSTGTVTITAMDNSVNAPDKTVTVSATASGGGVANPTDQTLTIMDDDTTPPTALTITVDTDSNTAGNQNSIGENAGETTVTVTATLDGTSRFGVNKDVTVTIGKESDTAVEGTDYKEVGNLTVRINEGDASGSNTFKLTPTDDVIDEQDETISVEGTLETLAVTNDSITITDDDEEPSGLTITVDTNPGKDGNQDSVDEDAATIVTVTAALNGTTSFGVDKTVTVKVGNEDRDSAKEGTDYETVNDLNLTLEAGKTSISDTFTLTPINDGIDEDNETISVEGTLTGLTVTHDSITITDDDEPPSGLTITVDTDLDTDGDQDSVDEDAEDGTRVKVTATLDGTSRFATDQTVTVTVGAGPDDTAKKGTDYEEVEDLTFTINAGKASGYVEFTLTPEDDNFAEGNETISVEGKLGSFDAKATIIITDNDAAPTGLRISVDTGSPENLGSSTRNLNSERDGSLLYENSGTTRVTVTAILDGTSLFGVDKTVAVSVGGGTAIPGTDYTAVSNFNITIGAGAKSGTSTFDITPIDDPLAEGDETINLEGTLTGITVTGTTITITDDDTAPTGITLTVNPASVGEEDEEPKITVKAAVNGDTRYTDAKTVTVSVGGGTATSGTDYEEVPGFNITIGAGAESATHTFTLILIDDKIHEGDETINVTGTSGSLTVTDATLTIEDDEELPVVSINSPSVKESGKSGVPTEMTFTVTIFPESTKLVTVSYADTGTGTATADKDYVSPGTGILTFAPGITRRRIAITVKGDDIDEYDETVVLRLSNPTNATLPDNVAALESTGTIIDNNEPPTVSLLDSEPVEEGEVAVFPVRLSGESGKPITVNWKTSSGTALEDIDYHGGSEQITIHAGTVEKTVEITTIDDREIEDWTENFSVALSDPVNVTPDSIKATGIIKDDDRPAAIERLERVNKTILPYVGSAIMRSRIDHVTGCIKHAASGVAYGDLSSFEGQLRNNADILEQHQMERISFLDVFNDARFASGFKAYEEKHNPGDVTFCAGSDWNELSGGDNDPVTWDGSLAGTHLGGNVRISEWILTGLDLFLYTGSFDWKDEGGEEEFRGIEGEWNLNIRGVNPYVALLSEDGETQFWTMAGYGFGRVDIEEEILDQSADITMKSVALGGAVPLRKGSGNVSLSLRGDVWLGEFEIAENGDLINGVSVQTRGARALLESTWNRGSITPSLLVGIKHDNSSSDSTGMEIGSGIEWGSASHGLRVSLKSRALLVRSSVQEWGVSGDVNLSPRDGLGPSLRLTTSRGDAEERASTFLEDDSETLLGESGEGGISFEAEAGWGIGTAGGRGTMTPFAGVSLLERDERVLRLGGRLDMGKTLNLQLEGQREKNEINGSEYGLLLEAKFSF